MEKNQVITRLVREDIVAKLKENTWVGVIAAKKVIEDTTHPVKDRIIADLAVHVLADVMKSHSDLGDDLLTCMLQQCSEQLKGEILKSPKMLGIQKAPARLNFA